jgi:hypothetical protein
MRDLNSVRCASGICPVHIRYVSGDCPAIPLISVRRLYQYRPDFIRPGPSEEIVDAKCEAILNSLPTKEPRSRLEPYGELITEMRKRGYSYREITQVLKKACGLKVGTSTVNDFVLRRSRSKAKRSVSPSGTIETKQNRRALTGTYRNTKAQESTRQAQKELEGTAKTIKELKDRPLKTRAKKLLFEYNPDEPLRLHRNQRTKE